VYAPDPVEKYNSELYLFCVNINTKYLVVYPLGHTHTKPEIEDKIKELKKKHFVSSIRGDGEFEWVNYHSSSPYDNHNRVVDRVIRTIRDTLGQNYYNMRDNNRVQVMVDYYYHTPHNTLRLGKMIFTPEEVEGNKDLEGIFMRKNKEILEVVQARQKKEGLHKYKTGNVIMVHLDFTRTPWKFMKTRRKYNALAVFKEYKHGNVVCVVYKSGVASAVASAGASAVLATGAINEEDIKDTSMKVGKEITVPIYYTKYVSENIETIPEKYKYYFL
jgi:hypothetical protein